MSGGAIPTRTDQQTARPSLTALRMKEAIVQQLHEISAHHCLLFGGSLAPAQENCSILSEPTCGAGSMPAVPSSIPSSQLSTCRRPHSNSISRGTPAVSCWRAVYEAPLLRTWDGLLSRLRRGYFRMLPYTSSSWSVLDFGSTGSEVTLPRSEVLAMPSKNHDSGTSSRHAERPLGSVLNQRAANCTPAAW